MRLQACVSVLTKIKYVLYYCAFNVNLSPDNMQVLFYKKRTKLKQLNFPEGLTLQPGS